MFVSPQVTPDAAKYEPAPGGTRWDHVTGSSSQDRAVELLQQLGLKEYEGRAFVALTQLSQGTANEVSDNSEVPRTRVYDAVRTLESMGLVEIHYSRPQRFRAVSVDEAVDTLARKYEDRVGALREVLGALEPVDGDETPDEVYEVWSLSDETAISNRIRQLIDEADEEVLFLVGEGVVLDDTLTERLAAAGTRGVTVVLGTSSEASRDRIQAALPNAAVSVTDQTQLQPPLQAGDDTEINRLVLTDRETILVSTVKQADGHHHEHATFGDGFDNGFVAIARRLVVSGLGRDDDSEAGEP